MTTPRFHGTIGRLRKILYDMGEDHEAIIFNDKRKSFRRLKIYIMPNRINYNTLYNNISNEFKDEVIKITIHKYKKWNYIRKCVLIYLNI